MRAASKHAAGMPRAESEPGERCAACGAAFACGAYDPAGCWCLRLPALAATAIAADAGCLCEPCLRRRLAAAPAASR